MEAEQRMAPRPWRLGAVGAGGFARFALAAAAALPEVELVAVADPAEGSGRAAVDAWQAARGKRSPVPAWCPDYQRLLAWDEIDVIWVLTPPHLHYPIGREALMAGKHLFLEKPGSLHPSQLGELSDLAVSRGLAAAVDFVMIHNPIHQAIVRWSAEGLLGPLERVAVENSARDDNLAAGHWFWDEARSGGIWVEHGVHFFDLVARLTGNARQVTATAALRPAAGGAALRDAVAAWVLHPAANDGTAPAVASYFHGFTKPGLFERTWVRLQFQRAYLEVEGWIACRVRGEYLAEGAEPLGRLLAGTPWLKVEAARPLEGSNGHLTGRGQPFEAWANICLAGDLGDRQEIYRDSIRAGLRDLLLAAAHPNHTPAASLCRAQTALEVAIAARTSQESGRAVDLGDTAERRTGPSGYNGQITPCIQGSG